MNAVTETIAKHIPKEWNTKTLMAIMHTGFVAAQNDINKEIEKNNRLPEEYDTTLTAVIYNGRKIVFGHVGDGGIIGLGSFGDFIKITEVQKGEDHNVVVPLRGGPEWWVFDYSEEEFISILLLTDGLLDIVLPSLLKGNIYINYVREFMDINVLGLTNANHEDIRGKIENHLKSDDLGFVTDDKTMVGLINCNLVPQEKDPSYYEEPNWKKLREEQNIALYGDADRDMDDNGKVEAVEKETEVDEQHGETNASEGVKKDKNQSIDQPKDSENLGSNAENKASQEKGIASYNKALEAKRPSSKKVKKKRGWFNKFFNKRK